MGNDSSPCCWSRYVRPCPVVLRLLRQHQGRFRRKDDAALQKSRLFRIMSNSTIVDIGSHITQLALQIGLPVQSILKTTIYEHFCGGETLEETEPLVSSLAEQGVSTILDYGVEAKESQDEFEANLVEQIRAIEFADGNGSVPYVSCKITGYAPFSLLEKLSSGAPRTEAEEAALDALRVRMHRICKAAAERDVCLYVDAEESWIQDAIDVTVMAAYNEGQFHRGCRRRLALKGHCSRPGAPPA